MREASSDKESKPLIKLAAGRNGELMEATLSDFTINLIPEAFVKQRLVPDPSGLSSIMSIFQIMDGWIPGRHSGFLVN